jgi:hypothetical protein
MSESTFSISPVSSVSLLLPSHSGLTDLAVSGNVDTILLLLSWDRLHDPSAPASSAGDGSALLASLFDTPNDLTEPLRLLLRLSKFNFFCAAPETGDTVLHLLSAKTSREVSPAVIWALWSREEAQLAKKERNREGKTAYQVALQRKDLFLFRFLWDLWMFRSLPRSLPLFVPLLACLAPSLLFPIWGWLFGSLATLCLLVLSDLLGQKTLPPQASRTAQGLAWGLLAVVILEFWTHLHPELPSSSPLPLFFYPLAALALLLMLRVSFSRARRAEPADR